MSSFSERCARIKRLDGQIMPLELEGFKWDTLYRSEAIQCFERHFRISCIVISSALVETCLSWELFRKDPDEKEKNAGKELKRDNLSCLFKEFVDSSVPLDKLLDSDEDIQDFRNNANKILNIKYILTANIFASGGIINPITRISPLIPRDGHKFDRGDLFYPSTYLTSLLPFKKEELIAYGIDDYEPILETVAYVHLFKTLRFMKAFTDLAIHRRK
jgi:hypothetical protein